MSIQDLNKPCLASLFIKFSCISLAYLVGCGTSTRAGYSVNPNNEESGSSPVRIIKHVSILHSDEVQTSLSSTLKEDCIQGVTIYFGWRDLEPNKGDLQITMLLAAIDSASQAGKMINVGILPGRWVPDYVMQDPSVPKMHWMQQDTYTEDGQISQAEAPIPWNPIYRSYFIDFIDRLSIALRGLPINSIAIAGGSNVNGLETDLIADDSELQRIGFTKDVYEQGWEEFIDAFAQSFPSTVLTLALHDTFGSEQRTDIAQDLMDYGRAKYGDRIYAQTDAFTGASWFNQRNQYAGLVLNEIKPGGTFQALEIYSQLGDLDGYEQMLAKADRYQPAWLEIWNDDITNFGCSIVK